MNLAALAEQNLEQFGEYERLIFEGERFTNAELHGRSAALSAGLTRLGLEPGAKVVVMMMNGPDVLVSYPAIWRAGGIAIPVLFLLQAEELGYILGNSGAELVITSPMLYPKVQKAIGEGSAVRHIVVTGPSDEVPDGAASFDELVTGAEAPGPMVERSPDDAAVILYTSGTTGNPKGVIQTHGSLLAATNNAMASAKGPFDRTTLLVLPLAHSFGLAVLIGGYLGGGCAVLMAWFEPESALRLIQEYRVAGMAGVPTMFVTMLNHPKASDYDTSSIERWLVGGAPMPTQQLAEFESAFGGVMYVGYGLTEACAGITAEREGMTRKPGSCGVPMENVEVKIVDDDGNAVAPSEKGEVWARGANISPGYFEMGEATAETFVDGWLRTGDIGYLDDDGYLFIVERKKDLIIRGGFNVYPKDVEEVLHRHPAVRECAVVGMADDVTGEEVCAFIVTRADVSADELAAHCREHLASYKTPRRFELVEALPKTNIGKIQKKELRRIAAELAPKADGA